MNSGRLVLTYFLSRYFVCALKGTGKVSKLISRLDVIVWIGYRSVFGIISKKYLIRTKCCTGIKIKCSYTLYILIFLSSSLFLSLSQLALFAKIWNSDFDRYFQIVSPSFGYNLDCFHQLFRSILSKTLTFKD